MIREKLQSLSSSLSEVYSRILNNIKKKNMKNVRFVLSLVITARRSLIVDELAMIHALDSEEWDKNIISTADTLNELKNDFKFCESLVYLNDVTQTINLIH